MATKDTQMQPEGTLTCLLNVRTIPARLFFWVNLPFCWLVVVLTLTGHLESWRRRQTADEQFWISIGAFMFGVWLFLTHTLGTIGAVSWELWWNPYAYHPNLQGLVDADEEEGMLAVNRKTAKRVLNDIFGDKQGTRPAEAETTQQ